MTCFHICARSGIELGLPVRCLWGRSAVEWKSGGHPSSSPSPPKDNVNPCLTQSSGFAFSSVSRWRILCLLVLLS